MTEDDFLRIRWPDVFTVNYHDGTAELHYSGDDGVLVTPPSDDPSNRAFISAYVRVGPRGRLLGRACYLDQVRSIVSRTGEVLWATGLVGT